MRERSDSVAPRAGRQKRQENQWIKSWSRFDLKDMRTDPIRQLAGAFGARAGLRENRRMARSPLTYRPSREKQSASQKRKSTFVDGGVAGRYPGSMQSGISSIKDASFTSHSCSGSYSPSPSGSPSPSNWSEAGQSPITARFAGLCVCRHLCGHLAAVPDSRVRSSHVGLTRALCSRRNRYRLRAGYATLLLGTARACAERPSRGSTLAVRCSVVRTNSEASSGGSKPA